MQLLLLLLPDNLFQGVTTLVVVVAVEAHQMDLVIRPPA
jgi:hypothetical protein